MMLKTGKDKLGDSYSVHEDMLYRTENYRATRSYREGEDFSRIQGESTCSHGDHTQFMYTTSFLPDTPALAMADTAWGGERAGAGTECL
jgi:hypothetical protein